MWVRHELSRAHSTSAPVARTCGEFVATHGHGRVGVLDGEHAAEAAAGVLFGRSSTRLEALDVTQEGLRRLVEAENAQRVARRVIRHGVVKARADVGDLQDVGEEFRELVGAPSDVLELVGERVVTERACGRRVEVAHRADARRRGRDDDVVVAEDLAKTLRQVQALPGGSRR